MSKVLGRVTAAAGAALMLVGGIAAPAYAADDVVVEPLNSNSSTAYFDDGASITANMWISTFADGGGCGDFQSSAVTSVTADWVKDVASFHANGVGASISGGSVSGSGADASASWTNYNATGAYISGNVCVNWLTWYLSATTTASGFHYGNTRIASAGV
jgi:hypothetical protein